MAWRKQCAWCGKVKTFHRKAQRYCNPQCAAFGRSIARSEEELHENAKKAGKASGESRKKKALAKWEGLSKQQVYDLGYASGYAAGRKRVGEVLGAGPSRPALGGGIPSGIQHWAGPR